MPSAVVPKRLVIVLGILAAAHTAFYFLVSQPIVDALPRGSGDDSRAALVQLGDLPAGWESHEDQWPHIEALEDCMLPRVANGLREASEGPYFGRHGVDALQRANVYDSREDAAEQMMFIEDSALCYLYLLDELPGLVSTADHYIDTAYTIETYPAAGDEIKGYRIRYTEVDGSIRVPLQRDVVWIRSGKVVTMVAVRSANSIKHDDVLDIFLREVSRRADQGSWD